MHNPSPFDRRTVLGSGAALAGLLTLPGCATTGRSTRPLPKSDCLVPVKVAQNRIIREVVGLRPYRPSGFVVRREALGDKQVIHNYGHGGGGITLSWGSSRLAVDLGLPETGGNIAVIGSGIMGLTTARLLQEAGRKVTIYTSKLPPFTTSNIAGGQFYPSGVFSRRQITPEFQQQFVAASEYSFQRFQLFVGEQYGVRWMPNYEISSRPIEMEFVDRLIPSLMPELKTVPSTQNPFGTAHLRVRQNMFIEPAKFLRQLQRDILLSGGKIEVRHFANSSQIMDLPEKTIFNCTGLGAAGLFGDSELTPVRGQLEILLPQPDVEYAYTARNGSYMFPRSDGIVLGGTYNRGVSDIVPSPSDRQNILDRNKAIADNLRCA